jgi:type III restriction enzyme
VKKNDKTVFIIETKGREDEDDKIKFERLQKWCKDVNDRQSKMIYEALYIKQEEWEENKAKNFEEIVRLFSKA